MLFILELSIIAAGLTLLLIDTIGRSEAEFSPREIFSFYTVRLSINRLKKVGLYDKYSGQYHENIERIKTNHELIEFKNEFNKVLVSAAEPFFYWEKAVGMCYKCTGFWVSLIIGLIFIRDISEIIEIIVISHITIRILNKIL